jgi:PAS domain S-box-containing protein
MKKNLRDQDRLLIILKNIFPVIFTILLFLVAFYFTVIPGFKQTMILHNLDLIIVVFLFLLSMYMVVNGMRVEKTRREVERSLAESEERFHCIFDNAFQFVGLLAPDGRILAINQTALNFFGSQVKEMIGKSLEDIWRDGPPQLQQAITSCAAGVVFRFETDCVGHSGEMKTLDISFSPLRDHSGKISQIIIEGRDITERKLAEEEIRKREENLEVTLNSIGDGVVVTDAAGHVVRMNPIGEKLTGWTIKEAMGKPIDKIFLIFNSETLQPIENPHHRVFNQNQIIQLPRPVLLRGKDNSERVISNCGAPIHDKSGKITGLILVFHDITEEIRLQDRLRQAQKMEAIGQLAGGIAHDFNNMLAGIIGNAELLKFKFQENREPLEYVQHIIEISSRAAELNSQLLAFARRGKVQQVFVDINDVIRNAIKMLEKTIDRRIVISRHFNANPSIINGDPSQLQNAILNVAINARDAMPQGGKLLFATEIKPLREVDCRKSTYKIVPGDYIEVCISDTGMGMSLETLKCIFEPFFTTKELGRGTGLGLSAVDGIVKDHHGAIRVRSELLRGTDFRLYFPLAAGDEKGPPLSAKKTVADQIISGKGHILVVDDEKSIRQMVTDMLNEIGYSVTSAANGARAVEIFRKNHGQIDLVLLDLIMPKKDGMDTFKELIGIDPGVRVLLSSGFQHSIKVQEMLDNGACGFINKPYLFSQLTTQIAEILQKKIRS